MIVESFRYVAAAGAALSVLTGCEDKQGFDPAKISSNLGVFTETSVSLADRRLVEIQIGNLKLPDGRLVAFDPLVQPESRPFAQTVTPGTYPVSFIRGAAGYSRPAMLVIRFSNAEIERFELATIEGQDVGSQVDWSKAKRPDLATKRVNVDFPTWMIESLDREASKLGVTRQSIIKVWLAERLESSSVAKAR